MFGELIGVWLLSAWQALGRPLPVTLAEIGPGRGTLMKDMLRTLGQARSGVSPQARRSPWSRPARACAEIQQATLGDSRSADRLAPDHRRRCRSSRCSSSATSCSTPSDPPVRQGRRRRWRERAVGLDEAGELRLRRRRRRARSGPAAADAADAPRRRDRRDRAGPHRADGGDRRRGSPRMAAPACSSTTAICSPASATRCRRCAAHRSERRAGQSRRGRPHRPCRLRRACAQAPAQHGLDAHLATQGDFLLGMGLLERAGRLGAERDAATRADACRARSSGLPDRTQMGKLFKVLAVAPAGVRLPPFGQLGLTCAPALPHCRAPERGPDRRGAKAP